MSSTNGKPAAGDGGLRASRPTSSTEAESPVNNEQLDRSKSPSSDKADQRLPIVDRAEAERFLNSVDPGPTGFTFQTFDDNQERNDKKLARVIHATMSDCWNELVSLNDKGAGVFVTICETDGQGRKAQNVVRVRALFVDLDGAPLDPVMRDPRTPHIDVESSPGKFHTYWLVTGIGLDEFEGFQKALAEKFGGDPSVHDLPRVMRLPGFVHRKSTTPFAVRIMQANERTPYTVADFVDIVITNPFSGYEPSYDESPIQRLNTAALKNLSAWV